MSAPKSHNFWAVWLTLILAILLSLVYMPAFMQIGRPLWVALFLTYWILALPHRVGMLTAWTMGLMLDVLLGDLLGQNALILTLIAFLVASLHQRLRMFPLWQQSMVLLVVFGLAQLLQLWLNALTGSRPPTLTFILPAVVTALLWPWVSLILLRLQERLNIY